MEVASRVLREAGRVTWSAAGMMPAMSTVLCPCWLVLPETRCGKISEVVGAGVKIYNWQGMQPWQDKHASWLTSSELAHAHILRASLQLCLNQSQV